MIRVMTVEDDVHFQYAIRRIIDWEAHGFRICAEAINGSHALELLEKAAPRIVITDISMPQMNGIELIRHLKTNHPDIRIVVLSAYDDFQFVKEALKLGAEDYLLKYDMEPQDVLKLMLEVRRRIEETDSLRDRDAYFDARMSDMQAAFAKRLLMEGIPDRKEIDRTFHALRMPLRAQGLQTAVVAVEPQPDPAGGLNTQTDLALGGTGGHVLTPIGDGLFALLINIEGVGRQEMADRFRAAVSAVHAVLSQASGRTVTIGTGGLAYDASDLPVCHRRAMDALEERTYSGGGRVYTEDSAVSARTPEPVLPVLDHERMELDTVVATVDAWLAHARLARMPRARLIEASRAIEAQLRIWRPELPVHSAVASGKPVGPDMGPSAATGAATCAESAYHAEFNAEFYADFHADLNADYTVAFDGMSCFDAIRETFRKRFERLRAQTALPIRSPDIARAVRHIDQHFAEDLQLTSLAEALGISPNYLSTQFKREMGIGFAAWLNRVRIDHARRLMRQSHLKTVEIARRVGFPNASYFSTVFKAVTGLTVQQFRRS